MPPDEISTSSDTFLSRLFKCLFLLFILSLLNFLPAIAFHWFRLREGTRSASSQDECFANAMVDRYQVSPDTLPFLVFDIMRVTLWRVDELAEGLGIPGWGVEAVSGFLVLEIRRWRRCLRFMVVVLM